MSKHEVLRTCDIQIYTLAVQDQTKWLVFRMKKTSHGHVIFPRTEFFRDDVLFHQGFALCITKKRWNIIM